MENLSYEMYQQLYLSIFKDNKENSLVQNFSYQKDLKNFYNVNNLFKYIKIIYLYKILVLFYYNYLFNHNYYIFYY